MQAHPEFASRPLNPAPPFVSLRARPLRVFLPLIRQFLNIDLRAHISPLRSPVGLHRRLGRTFDRTNRTTSKLRPTAPTKSHDSRKRARKGRCRKGSRCRG